MKATYILIVLFLPIFLYGQDSTLVRTLDSVWKTDQMHRQTNEPYEAYKEKKQAALDRKNRIVVDSIYDIYGLPSVYVDGLDGQHYIWSVMQHSLDCEFNQKWFFRFITLYQAGECHKITDLINGTFHRFFISTKEKSRSREIGYCYQQDSKQTDGFVMMLRETFPPEYAKTFGYDKY